MNLLTKCAGLEWWITYMKVHTTYIAKIVAEEEKERRESRSNKLHP